MSFNENAANDFLDGRNTAFNSKKAEEFLNTGKIPESEVKLPISEESTLASIWTGANEYAAGAFDVLFNTLGMPGDVVNWAAEKMGAEYRAHGSQAFREFGEKARLGSAKGHEPDTAAYKSGEYTAIGLEFLAPILRAGKGAISAIEVGKTVEPIAGIMKGVAQKVTAPFITHAKTAYASELASSAASGIGAYYGEKEYGQWGELAGGILFAVPSAAIPYALPKIKEAAVRTLFPYTKAGASAKAGARLRELSETGEVLKTLEKAKGEVLPFSRIPPAKLSGDKHLIALQNRILKDEPELLHKFELEAQATNEMARKELEKLGGNIPIEETQAWMAYRVKRVKDLIDYSIDKSILKAKESLTGLNPKEQRKTVNSVVKQQVDNSLSEARAIENEVWDKVDKTVSSSTKTLKDIYRQHLLAREITDDPGEIPDYLSQFLGKLDKKGKLTTGKLGKKTTVNILHALRKRLINLVREEKAKDVANWNKIRIANDIQEAILKDIGNTDISKQFQVAIATSRELNEKFRGGVMDIILGHERTGGRVAPEIALESIKGGPKAAVQMREVLNASPESYGMLEELMKINMVQSNVISSKGRININAARKYIDRNEDMLEMFPDIAKSLNHAIGIEERATRLTALGKKRLADLVGSRAAKIAGYKPGRVLTEIMTAKNPEQEMAKVINQSNLLGKKGLKNDVIDYMIKKSRLGEFDEHGNPIMSGKKMIFLWKTEGKVLGQPLNKNEKDRVGLIINTFIKNEEKKILPKIGDVVTPANPIVNAIVTTIAARFGAKLGAGTSGASLKTASMMSANAQKIVNHLDVSRATQLLKDAIQDRDLFKALYADASKPKEIMRANKVLQGWMIAHTVATMEEK